MSELPPPTAVPEPSSPEGPKPWWRRWWAISLGALLALFIVAGIIGSLTSDDDSVRSDSTGPATSAAEDAQTEASAPSDASAQATASTESGSTERSQASSTSETPATLPATVATTTIPSTTLPPTTIPPATLPPTTPPPTIPPIPTFGGGQQLVGQDIQPGVYITAGAASFNCYYERLSGLSGEFSEIIANGNANGQVIIEIAPSDAAFNSQGCEEWVAFLGGPPVETFGDGDWAVGSQITPGRWATEGDPSSSNCYWERASGFTHSFDDIIANDNSEGRAIVDISPDDLRFTASGCGTWTRVG